MTRARTPGIRNYEPLLLFLGVALLLFLGKTLIIPLAFALTLCFLMLPTIRRLEHRRVPRPVAVALVGTLTCLVLLTAAYAVSKQIVQLAQTLPKYRDNMHQRMASLHSPAEASIEAAVATLQDVGEDLTFGHTAGGSEPIPVRLVSAASRLELASEVISLSLRPLAELGIVLVFAMYMLMKREELRRRLLMLAGSSQLGLMTRTLDEAANRISRYLVLQFEVNACYGFLFGAGLYAIGVPNAALWAVIAGALRIIPYAGTTIGMLLPLIAAFAVSTTWWPPLMVLAWFIGLETTAVYILEPRILSSRTGISSLALLVSAIFWTMLWGWPGLALATPMTVCVVVIGQYVPKLSFLHSLLGTDAQLSPAAHFYERLLATDQAEAYAIAEQFLKERSLLALYDSVLIRSLHLAKEDRHKGALDEARTGFVHLSIGELVARLSEYRERSPELETADSREIRIESLPSHFSKEIAVICISAGDTSDDLATQMLSQLLERAHYHALTLRPEALSEEILTALASEKATVVVISALAPFAFAGARAICQTVRHHLVENRIAIALWHDSEDHDETLARFGACRPDALVGTLAQTLSQVSNWQKTRH